MSQPVLLLCCVFLSLVAACPSNAQKGGLTFQPSFTETRHPLDMLSNKIPLPDPKTCQDLLHTAPSLAPLPEYLSNLALEVALEEAGCPTEVHILQLQLVRMGGKDTTETLTCESKKHNEEEGICNTKVILRDLGGLAERFVPDLRGLRLIMIPAELLLLCYLLLRPADAASYGNQTNVLMHLPSSSESWLPSSDPLSCQTLLPKSLPGFTHMAPVPKFLVGLSLVIALEKAGCHADVRTLQRQLYRQGSVNTTQILIRHLQGLEKGRSTGRAVSVDALASALQLLAREQPGQERARRSLPIKHCEHEKEQVVHNIVRLLPGVGTFYNLGTALYYAAQNCSDKAKERGQDGVIDLGYDLLMTMAGLSGGPTGLAISAALKPAVKAGVQKLIQYYNEKEANTPLPETSTEGLGAPQA